MKDESPNEASAPSYKNIREYISSGWDSLTRSLDDCKTYQDVKTSGEPTLYLPASFPRPPALGHLIRNPAPRVAKGATALHWRRARSSYRLGRRFRSN
jgi:hypothetical protein